MIDQAVPLLEQSEDHESLVHLFSSRAYSVANVRWQYEEMARSAEEALRHARLARRQTAHLFSLDMALVYGPRPADEALATLDSLFPDAPAPSLLLHRAWLLAMVARFDEAWTVGLEGSRRAAELGGYWDGENQLCEVATMAGDPEASARYLHVYCERLEEHGERPFLSTYAPRLARALCAAGRHQEAERWALLGRELGDPTDIATQCWWRQAQALVLAHRGEQGDAEALAREAVSIIERTDALSFQGDAWRELAEVLALSGCLSEAATALGQALERYERKKNLAMVAQVRPKLEALRAAATQ